jgi:hypothetical protein
METIKIFGETGEAPLDLPENTLPELLATSLVLTALVMYAGSRELEIPDNIVLGEN